jgi:hypothetical protein
MKDRFSRPDADLRNRLYSALIIGAAHKLGDGRVVRTSSSSSSGGCDRTSTDLVDAKSAFVAANRARRTACPHCRS